MASGSQYRNAVIAGMQMLYGEGFLSPGGAGEVGELVAGTDLAGRHLLDLGCGIGGAAFLLAGEFGAARVTGIDVEAGSIERARAAAAALGLDDRITLLQAPPGPLPLPDRGFEAVLCKDVICHVPDKAAFLAEVFRVLKPGGRFLCADFLDGTDRGAGSRAAAVYRAWVDEMQAHGLSFRFEREAVYREALAGPGFEVIGIHDHTATSAGIARRELAFVESPADGPVKEALGADLFAVRIRATAMRLKALESGGLLHYHIRASRPG